MHPSVLQKTESRMNQVLAHWGRYPRFKLAEREHSSRFPESMSQKSLDDLALCRDGEFQG